MVLNRGWSQTIYHYQMTSCICSETEVNETNETFCRVIHSDTS